MNANYYILMSTLLACVPVRAELNELGPQSLIQGNTAFSFELYRAIHNPGNNLFFSPYSISSAMTMTYAGAEGDTRAQIRKGMHFPAFSGHDELHASFGEIDRSLEALQGEGVVWNNASAIWPHNDLLLRQEFQHVITNDYRSSVLPVDFSATEAARSRINKWVEKNTGGRIANHIAEGLLSPRTRMVLVNAVYFKGAWEVPFNSSLTKDMTFNLGNGSSVYTPMMHGIITARYAEWPNRQILELPYCGGRATMLIVLPGSTDEMSLAEETISTSALEEWSRALRPEKVDVFLPRFKVTGEFNLGPTLKSMGIRDAFDPELADFTGMSDSSPGLYLSEVVHKAMIEVTEEGTEAAAASGVIMTPTSILPKPMPVFRADRPFLFIIRDRLEGTILFMGRLSNPKGGS